MGDWGVREEAVEWSRECGEDVSTSWEELWMWARFLGGAVGVGTSLGRNCGLVGSNLSTGNLLTRSKNGLVGWTAAGRP